MAKKTTEKKPAAAKTLRILMIASEYAPFAKTGGLADAVAGLAGALTRQGHAVTLVLPGYRALIADAADAGHVTFPLLHEQRRVPLRRFEAGGVELILIDEPLFTARDALYGERGAEYPDNALRFALLSRAALAYAVRDDHPRFDVVHAHDWHASLAPVFLKTRYHDDPRRPAGSVFTIHNLAFQGLFDVGELPSFDLDPGLFTVSALEYWGRASALKGGIVFADRVTTVSPSYARETRDSEFGFGFQGILRERGSSYTGILNGIDTDIWDPARDTYLPEPYDRDNLAGKAAARAELLKLFNLPVQAGPLLGMVSRLSHQKGTDLARQMMPRLAGRASLVLLGSGDADLEEAWRALAAAHPGRVGVHIGFDERIAHLIEAGSDMFLMPSRYEPCGLNQMYSLRYGTPPVVHAVGGLNDTVTEKNGFKFFQPTPDALYEATSAAIDAWGDQRKWRQRQRNGMKSDYSWDRSAREYVKVYKAAVRRSR